MLAKYRIISGFLLLLVLGLGYFIYTTESSSESRFPFQLGLDLEGGVELIYQADTSSLEQSDIKGSMESLRGVVERRIDNFGVTQPVVRTERTGVVTGDIAHRLVVELPGVTDIDRATTMIGETPLLEFKLLREGASPEPSVELERANGATSSVSGQATSSASDQATSTASRYKDTGLTGRYLVDAQLQFNQTTGKPYIGLQFNSEGAELFADLTRENQGRVLAIFLDGQLISSPVIQDAITGGQAQISGGFGGGDGLERARGLVNDLKFGALPVPIELINTQRIGPTLGQVTLEDGVSAGLVGLALVSLFLLLWYRLPGAVAVGALVFYILLMLSLFKLIPVTLTAAGIAGFILSLGMAVDANILIFERMKEELRSGQDLVSGIQNGFSRAWPSIRDANISSLISAVILYWMGTSLIQGFALVFGLGVLVSMITAIVVSRTWLLALSSESASAARQILFGTGIGRK